MASAPRFAGSNNKKGPFMVDRNNTAVTEDELHVYVDGELPADRRQAVETWLSNHPDDAARGAAGRAQAEAIRARYGAVIHEPVPDRLTLGKIMRNRRSWGAVAATAAVGAFGIGGGAGGGGRGARVDGGAAGPPRPRRPPNCSPPTRSKPISFTSAKYATRSRSRPRKTICCPGCRGGLARPCGRRILGRSI